MSRKVKIGTVRRTDLYLRAEYPELDTTIYRIDEHQFLIYSTDFPEDFEGLKKEFDYKIRLISALVELTENEPDEYLEIITKIDNKDISKNFEGIPMSKITLFNVS